VLMISHESLLGKHCDALCEHWTIRKLVVACLISSYNPADQGCSAVQLWQ
jgi:hypothetical protein